MDEDKVTAVTTCPTPTIVKKLKLFLGFPNFYQQFIRSFSSITSSLTARLKKGPKCLQWNPEELPDPMKPLIVEVDTSE